MNDNDLMEKAILMAARNVEDGGLPYAAIIAKGGKVIGRGVNRVHKTKDPSDHAEMRAIREASLVIGSADLSGCKIYVLGQPCAMCLACLVIAKLDEVVYAVDMHKKDAALSKLPLTAALYETLGSNVDGQDVKAHSFGTHDSGVGVIKYQPMPAFSAQAEAVFKAWNGR